MSPVRLKSKGWGPQAWIPPSGAKKGKTTGPVRVLFPGFGEPQVAMEHSFSMASTSEFISLERVQSKENTKTGASNIPS